MSYNKVSLSKAIKIFREEKKNDKKIESIPCPNCGHGLFGITSGKFECTNPSCLLSKIRRSINKSNGIKEVKNPFVCKKLDLNSKEIKWHL